jgi:hypothetical protein
MAAKCPLNASLLTTFAKQGNPISSLFRSSH